MCGFPAYVCCCFCGGGDIPVQAKDPFDHLSLLAALGEGLPAVLIGGLEERKSGRHLDGKLKIVPPCVYKHHMGVARGGGGKPQVLVHVSTYQGSI